MRLIPGDCVASMKEMPDDSVDSIVTDPPYELGFMGKSWDSTGIANSVEMWRQALRVLKPGGHLLAFSGSRTYHRMAVAIEDAGFQIRDQIMWVYGSGFPKSHDISKSLGKKNNATRGRVPYVGGIASGSNNFGGGGEIHRGTKVGSEAITDEAKQWQGWGTALKPAHEPIVLARKPFPKGYTVAQNVLEFGVGGLNIDGTRVGATNRPLRVGDYKETDNNTFAGRMDGSLMGGSKAEGTTSLGRFPANFIHDGSDEVLELFPSNVKGEIGRVGRSSAGEYEVSNFKMGVVTETGLRDSGSAARFFYCAKTSKRDRNEGLEGFEVKQVTGGGGGVGNYLDDVNSASGKYGSEKAPSSNNHPTVKPTDLMRYLCRLVTPVNGTVLDPFMGSGSTGKGAVLEGFDFIGCEMEPEYLEIARARIEFAIDKLREELPL